jgi:transposase
MPSVPPIPAELWNQIPPAAQTAILSLVQRYEQRLQELHQQVAELQQRLNQNSTNSSKPPSSDPPTLKRPPPKTPSAQRAGGQHGHAKAQRALHDRPDRVLECKPTTCRHCRQPLHGDDPQPLRHQVWDIPPLRPIVTEYRRHRLRCPRCGVTTCGQAPVGQDGPRLKAACVLLTGAYRLSKAKAARLLTDLFAIPLCAGQVCATEAEVGQQLQPVVDELLAATQQLPANVDETSMGRGRWLWVMVTAVATVYQIARGRNRDALRKLLGAGYRRVLTSDRHKTYDHLAQDRHQLCWSHLRRDFQAMVDRHNAGSMIGRELLAMSGQMLGWWKRVRDGTLTKVRFAGRLHAERDFRVRFRAVLTRGSVCGCAKTAATCRELLRREVSLFLFAFVSGVEPTNNAAERALRHGVLWRKMSHGPKSVAGSEYLGCIWSVVETCRQQSRGVWDYLTSCVAAAAEGCVMPSLLNLSNTAHAA